MSDSRAEDLIRAHLPLVRIIAARVRRTHRLSYELDDLTSLGTLGLVEAARRFDASRGHRFASFAYARIRGAILDGLAELCPAHCRLVHRGFSACESWQLPCERERADQRALRLENVWAVRRALAMLSERDGFLLRRRYWDRRTLVSISEELGVSKSRATRLHAKALRRLREHLELQNGDSDAGSAPGVGELNGGLSQVEAMSSLVSS